MSREQFRQRRSLLLTTLVLGALGFTWYGMGQDGLSARPEPAALPNLWQWKLSHVPRGKGKCELVLLTRCVSEPFGEVLPPARRTPVREGEGVEKILTVDHLPANGFDGGGVAFQIFDVREFGAAVNDGDPALRAVATVQAHGSMLKGSARLSGHSVRGQPTVHPGVWSDGEMPLLTVVTTDEDVQHTYTLALAVRPAKR